MPTTPAARDAADARQRHRDAEVRVLGTELLRLRKYGGVTPARLAREKFLVQVLGGSHEPFEVLRERFVSAIRSLRDPEPELLLAVYGLTDATAGHKKLNDRRALYGVTIGRKAPTVADLEEDAVANLRTQLLTGWYPLSPLGTFVSPAHNGAAFESVHIELLFRGRRLEGTRETWRMLALFDEAEYVKYSSSYGGEVTSLTDDFTVRTVRAGRGVEHEFRHREPMHRGGVYTLRFIVTPKEADATDFHAVTETSRAFHEPTRLARFEATFLGDKPARIWAYERLSYFQRPGVPDEGVQLDFVGDTVRVDFHDLQGGLFNGMAWE